MALTAPTYGGPQVAPSAAAPALLNASASPNAAALGGGIVSAADDLKAVVDFQRAQADDVAVSTAWTQLRATADDAQYGKNGYSYVKGAQALSATDAAQATFDKQYEKIAAGLTPQQRVAFEKVGRERRLSFHTDAGRHAIEQMNVAADDTFKQSADSLIQDASRIAANGGVGFTVRPVDSTRNPWTGVIPPRTEAGSLDDARIQATLDEGDVVARAYAATNAARLGMPPATFVRLEREERHSATHAAVLDAIMATGNDALAKSYFDKHRDEMDSKVRDGMQSRVTGLSDAAESIRVADHAFGSHVDADAPDSIGEQEAAAVADIRAHVEDPVKQKAAVAEVRGRFKEQRAENDAIRNDAYNTLDTQVEAGDTPWPVVEASSAYQALNGKDRSALKQRWQQVDNGETAITDPKRLAELDAMAANPETALEFAGLNLHEDRKHLAPADLADKQALQKTIIAATKDGDKNAKAIYDGFLTERDVVSGYAQGLYPDSTDKAQVEGRNAFERAVNDEARAKGKVKGTPLDRDEVEAIAKRLAAGVVTSNGFFYGTNSSPLYKAALDAGTDPLDALDAQEWLAARGLPVNINTIKARVADATSGR